MNRPSMLANLDRVLSHVKKAQKKGGAAQASLFGVDDLPPPDYIAVPDWDMATKLWHERKALGTFVTCHPVHLLPPGPWQDKVTHTCNQSYEMLLAGNERIVCVGLLDKVEQRGRVVLMELTDWTGRCEIMSFRDDFERFEHVLQKDNIIAASLEPRYRNNGQQASLQLVRAHRLYSFSPTVAK